MFVKHVCPPNGIQFLILKCPPKTLFPETVTLNLLLGSDDPDNCNFKMVSSWPPSTQSKEKRDVCKTCLPPLMVSNS